MKYCPNCREVNHDEASFCTRCGSKIHFQQETHVPPLTPAPNVTYSPTPSNGSNPDSTMPATYLWQAIVITVACCVPLGIPAIVYASQVEKRFLSGDMEGAKRASRNARNFALWGLVTGVVFCLFYFMFVFFGALGEELFPY